MRILIADDDAVVLRLVLRLLAQRGHACTTTNSGTGLKWLARSDPPDAVLSDISLGDDDGVAVCLRLRAERPGLRILMMTADPASAERAARAGLGRALQKPFTVQELHEALAAIGA